MTPGGAPFTGGSFHGSRPRQCRAVPLAGDRTRFAFLGGTHIPAQRAVAPALGILGRWAAPKVLTRFDNRVHQRDHGS